MKGYETWGLTGLAPGIALWCLWLSIFSGHEDIAVEHPGAIIKKFKGISMAMGLPSSSYLPVRSFVSLFINKHGKLDEHSKNQCCDCWAYHEMVSTFFLCFHIFSLSARSPETNSCKVSWCKYWKNTGHVCSPATCFASDFAGSLADYEDFGFRAKGACETHPFLWWKMRRGTPLWSQGVDQILVPPELDGLRHSETAYSKWLMWRLWFKGLQFSLGPGF